MIRGVQVDDLDCNFLSEFKHIGRLLDPLLGDLRDMKQSVNARCQLNESAEVCHSGDLSFDDAARCELLFRIDPRIGLRELQTQSHFGVLDILDQDIELLSDLEQITRVVHATPAHF